MGKVLIFTNIPPPLDFPSKIKKNSGDLAVPERYS